MPHRYGTFQRPGVWAFRLSLGAQTRWKVQEGLGHTTEQGCTGLGAGRGVGLVLYLESLHNKPGLPCLGSRSFSGG